MSYKPKEHEELFEVKPIGVRYVCEFCNEGEMKYEPTLNSEYDKMYVHKCTKCFQTLLLPKIYPYIEWEPV